MDDRGLTEAIRRHEERLARDPESLAFAQLADLYRKAGRPAAAITLCRDGLQRWPHYTTARLILAKSLLADGQLDPALAEVNDSKYGLQAGVFTNDINRAFEAHRTLEVGGVIVNDVSSFRADQMPYGGSKDSGFGREGLRFAMEEMTEPRIMVLSHVPM